MCCVRSTTALGQDGPDELDLAHARLSVASGDGGDGAVVLDDAIAVRPDRLGGRDVAVLVEDLWRARRPWPSASASGASRRSGVGDRVIAAAGEEPIDGRGVLVVEVAEQLVGERAVGLREQRVGEFGDVVRQRRAAAAGRRGARLGRASTRPCSTSEARCWRAPLTVMSRASATSSTVASPIRRTAYNTARRPAGSGGGTETPPARRSGRGAGRRRHAHRSPA